MRLYPDKPTVYKKNHESKMVIIHIKYKILWFTCVYCKHSQIKYNSFRWVNLYPGTEYNIKYTQTGIAQTGNVCFGDEKTLQKSPQSAGSTAHTPLVFVVCFPL